MLTGGSQAAPAIVHDAVDSTNAEARRLAEAGETGPVWIAARTQTAGRGRRGRAWSSPEGNLSATLLDTTALAPAEAARVSFVAALAAHDVCAAFCPPALVRLKWPNDVEVDGAKACGVLVESGARAGAGAGGGLWLAIGVGINLVHAPSQVERPATTLAQHLAAGAPEPTFDAALDHLRESFARRLRLWTEAGFAAVADAWTARAAHLGRRCAARLPNETVEGIAEGLEPDGALRLRTADGALRRITAGDVFPVGSPVPSRREPA